jgi:hypothetical protein
MISCGMSPFFSTVTSNITLFAYPGLSPGPRMGLYGVRLSLAPPLCLPISFSFSLSLSPDFISTRLTCCISSTLPTAMSHFLILGQRYD